MPFPIRSGLKAKSSLITFPSNTDVYKRQIRYRVDVVDNPNQDLAVRAVIVILERQLLQMCKQIFSDIIDDTLTDIHHNAASDCCEDHAHQIDADQHSHKDVYKRQMEGRAILNVLESQGYLHLEPLE